MKGFNQINVPLELPMSTYGRLCGIAKQRKIPAKQLLDQFIKEIAIEVYDGDMTPRERKIGKKIIRNLESNGVSLNIGGYLSRLLTEFIDSYDLESEAA